MSRRILTADEDAMIREAHQGKLHMRELARKLRCSYEVIYRRMEELDLPRRKPDPRRSRLAA